MMADNIGHGSYREVTEYDIPNYTRECVEKYRYSSAVKSEMVYWNLKRETKNIAIVNLLSDQFFQLQKQLFL
jgi:hypothetical protein